MKTMNYSAVFMLLFTTNFFLSIHAQSIVLGSYDSESISKSSVNNTQDFEKNGSQNFTDLFLVGAATAPGWDNDNNNPPLVRDPQNTELFIYTGRFLDDQFKVLEQKGAWQPQWGVGPNGNLVSSEDLGADPGVFDVFNSEGYYTITLDLANLNYSINPFDESSAVSYSTIGLIGSTTTGDDSGWNQDIDLTQSTFDPHLWYINDLNLFDGDAKFRADNAWNTNWGSDTKLTGFGTLDGPVIPVDPGTYDIWFNDLDGSYVFINLQNNPSDCQVTDSFMTGDYFLTQTTPASNSPFGLLSFEDQIVNITLGDSSEKRVFSAVWLESQGAGQPPMDVSFALDCSNGSDIIVDNDLNTFLTCAAGDPNIGNITLGPATTTGTFDVNDDGSFSLILAEFVDDGGCGVPNPVVTEFSLTKCTPKPDNISFTNPTATSVDLNWVDIADTANTSNTYTIEYGVEGFDLGTGQVINNVSGSSIIVNNLQTDVMYDFYISSDCSGVLNTSDPFPYGNFTNSDFVLDANGVTCLCPNANFGDVGTLTINGEAKTFTKRSRAQLDTVIADDIQDPQIALTCTSGIIDMSELFSANLVDNANSFNQNLQHWDVSNVTNMFSLFSGASSFNQPLNMWDVSQVTNMSRMFGSAPAFNQPLDNWDVSNVTDMSFMFLSFQPASFDQNINSWDVSNVTNMAQMFPGQALNQPLDNWDVSQVTDMNAMFAFSQFNQPLNNWDVSSVTNMAIMFADHTSFNQPLDNWDVSNVTSMSGMFRNTVNFNQDLSGWNFNQNVVFNSFLNNTDLSNLNYDMLLQSFDNQGLIDKNLEAIGLGYCDEPTRNNLINTKNWTITGDVLGQCGATFNPSTTPFVTTWTVQQDDLDIEIYTINAYDYDFTIDWGDGQTEQNLNGDVTHTYANPGTYTVSITGVFPYFKTCKISTGPTFFDIDCDNATKLSSVESWGDQEWRLMDGSFNTAENVNLNTFQAPDLSFVTSLKDTFKDAESFNQDINSWDVSNVTDMSGMFDGAISFNQPLDNWDVSNVSNMSNMFTGAVFNQTINNWNVSNVTDMSNMFRNTSNFNQLLDNWDVSSVTNMSGMFSSAESFNRPLNDWDVSNVTNMSELFGGLTTTIFNQSLDNWDVSSVTNMDGMFNSAESFNRPLSNWDVSNVTNMRTMFNRASSFDQDISSWNTENVTDMDFMFFNATIFNQDITDWCVEQIPTQPNGFAFDSALQASFFPDWGATCTLGLAENSLDNFKVYPNPSEGQLNLSWSSVNFSDEMNIQVYNLSGKKVFDQSYDQKPSELNVSQLSSGVYLLKVNSGDQSAVRRIVKK